MPERHAYPDDAEQELVVQAYESRDGRELALLATKTPLVRQRVAASLYTPTEVLELLTEDKDTLTSTAARVNLYNRVKKKLLFF